MFFNGNTFADVGRQLATALFADFPSSRRREIASIIGHYIAGVLDRESMVTLVDSLCAMSEFKPGDRVKTLRGSTSGVIVRILDDGRIVFRPDAANTELTALPENLLRGD